MFAQLTCPLVSLELHLNCWDYIAIALTVAYLWHSPEAHPVAIWQEMVIPAAETLRESVWNGVRTVQWSHWSYYVWEQIGALLFGKPK